MSQIDWLVLLITFITSLFASIITGIFLSKPAIYRHFNHHRPTQYKSTTCTSTHILHKTKPQKHTSHILTNDTSQNEELPHSLTPNAPLNNTHTNNLNQQLSLQNGKTSPNQLQTSQPTIQPNNSINKSTPKKSVKSKIGRYRLGRRLGRSFSTFSSVIKLAVDDSTNKQVAMKILNKKRLIQTGAITFVKSEIEILSSLNHPYIANVYEIIETDSSIYVAMEYHAGGKLFDLIVSKTRLVESEARKYFQQIIFAIEYCHYNDIVHRDLKPENIFLDNQNDIRIQEFHLSGKIKDNCLLKTSCGSPNYVPPEMVCDALHIGQLVDVWSIGVILYAMLCGCLPFDDPGVVALFKKVKCGQFVIPHFVSTDAADLLRKMIEVEPLKRITIGGIKKHCWFQKNLAKYLSGECYEYCDGNDAYVIVGNKGYLELRQQNSNVAYLSKEITNLIYRMLNPMVGVINNEEHRIKCLRELIPGPYINPGPCKCSYCQPSLQKTGNRKK